MAQGQIGVANNLEKLKMMKQMHMMQPMAPLAAPEPVKPPESLEKKAGNMVVDTALNKGIDEAFAAGMGSSGSLGAAMGAAGPYALAAMAAGKLFGLYSSGGHVGPLYASRGRKAVEGESIEDQLMPYFMDKYIEEQDKIKDEIEQSRYKYAGGTKAPVGQQMMQGSSPDNSFAGPISKLKLQDAEGNVKETTYGR